MEYELYHHGILGQKWGVRRFQNPDGTLTSAGRKRLGVKEGPYESNRRTQNGLFKKSGAKIDGYSKQKMPGKVTNLSEDDIKKEKSKILASNVAMELALIGSGIVADYINKRYGGGMGLMDAVKDPKTKQGKITIGTILGYSAVAGLAIGTFTNNYNKIKKLDEKEEKEEKE